MGSTNTHIFAFFVSIPSPMVSHEEIIIISSSSVLSNFLSITSLCLGLTDEDNSVICTFVYFLISGNSVFCICLKTALNIVLSTKFITEVSLSVLTSEWNVNTRLLPVDNIARAMLSNTDLFVFSVNISILISNGFR